MEKVKEIRTCDPKIVRMIMVEIPEHVRRTEGYSLKIGCLN